MNKGELVTLLSAKTGVSKSGSKDVLDALVEIIGDSLQSGNNVQIAGFGTFKVTDRAARMGRNPKTGEALQIKASRSPSFKAGKGLKEKVNG
ncbi:MAG: HU family DNA-binding protein [Gammaproteobacteria bacterium]|uniref:HU family DNA-binding protein n=1 Tax=Candidatus Thiopontia autotrophica TaxID=2841688 RepID=A0A8J6NXL0_9GAMM|nr:HU family DNA-binding protein [Candidatus Thiopontia autotrophica]MBL6968939.1 HU family DNA-binding protein [Gammaproteobacteria bacterium]